MDTKTLTALKGSTEHWRNIAAGKEGERSTTNCPLCQEFLREGDCTDCPIALNGSHGCYGTPYTEWHKHQWDIHRDEYFNPQGRTIRCPTCKEIAVKETQFVESFLSESEKGSGI
jgi:hypothetical protein